MKRILTIVSVLSLVLASGAMAEDYGWSVSLSSTDPNVNVGPTPPAFQATNFYLWLNCNIAGLPDPGGASAAGMTAAVTGNIFAGGLSLSAGVLNAGDGVNLQLAIGGCPQGPFLAGWWNHLPLDANGIDVCLEGVNVTVDCDLVNPLEHAHAVVGCSTSSAQTPCVVGTLCEPVSTESASWGTIKGLYR